MIQGDALTSVSDALAQETSRLATRLRALPESRLSRPFPPRHSRAQAAHGLAQALADLAQSLAERGRLPQWRTLPWLGPFVVADQVAVTANDLLAEIAVAELALAGTTRLAPTPATPEWPVEIWARQGRRPLLAELDAAATEARELRLAL